MKYTTFFKFLIQSQAFFKIRLIIVPLGSNFKNFRPPVIEFLKFPDI